MALYGRGPLLRGLLPRLTGLETGAKPRLVRTEHPRDLPVVLATGGHGAGKTAVLDAVRDAYADALPLARVDLAELAEPAWSGGPAGSAGLAGAAALAGSGAPGAPPSNTSGVVEVLVRLATGLAAPVPGYRRLRFPRLLPGLFAVSSWRRGHGEQRALATARFGALLPLADGGEGVSGEEWAERISARLAGAAAEEDVEPVAELVVGEYAGRHLGGKERDAVAAWYAERSPGQQQGDPLVRLCLDFHQGGDLQAPVEQTLVAALLDDLEAHWSGWWMRVNRKPRPLALLDDAHTAAGRAFLARVLEHRCDGATDPLVVVATGLGGAQEAYPAAVRRPLAELAHGSGWERREGHERHTPEGPSAGVLSVPLPPLAPADVRALLQRTPRPVHARLQTVLYRLTGGHPQGSALLCDAVVAASAARDLQQPVRPDEVLDLEAEDSTPAGELLVQRLLPELPLRYHLMVLALARDRQAAEALATGALPARPTAGGPGDGADGGDDGGDDGGADAERAQVAEAARYLEREQWTPDPGGPLQPAPSFVAHPFLHTLLVHELRRDSPHAEPGRKWDDLHALLCAHHEERGPEGEPDVLRHLLARGEVWEVVERLARALTEGDDARGWLAALRHLVTAPHPPPDQWQDERPPTALGSLDHRHPGADGVRRSVNRLLHALWYLDDPLREPMPELCTAIGKELGYLAPRHASGFTVLDAAGAAWAAAARDGIRPYPIDGLD
ncbi:ATP-binding protein [Streptomyces boncukensis]|uniref:ATP-binding protein n=1 Tax=Streptomyces boncukensis TaxID=2711219 RepID=A0A6G4WSA4_9ACTN|nr:ATP-binding protein [Streptomyces boncukensis]NGO67988.1 ATP-binding protein [Streptomyces boncukensis]